MREIKNREKLKGRALDSNIEKKLLKFLESSRTFWKILEYSRRCRNKMTSQDDVRNDVTR